MILNTPYLSHVDLYKNEMVHSSDDETPHPTTKKKKLNIDRIV